MKKMSVVLVVVGVSAAVLAQDQPADGLEVTGSLGVNGSRGNSESSQVNAALESVWRRRTYRVDGGISAAYGEANADTSVAGSEPERNTQKADAYLNGRRRYHDAFGYINAALKHDDIADVDYRFNIGPGVGWVVLEKEDLEIGAEVGAGYLWEQVSGDADDYATLRAAAQAKKKLTDTSSLWLKGEYVPNVSEFSQYQLVGEIGAQSSLTEKMGLRITVKDEYDSRPATGRDHNDLTYNAAITWTL